LAHCQPNRGDAKDDGDCFPKSHGMYITRGAG
jgi:hypothetical protein